MSLWVVCLETDAPHGVKRAGLSQTFGASAQKVLFHGRVLSELGEIASKDGVFAKTVPNNVVEITHVSINALVRARIGRRHGLLGVEALEKAGLFRHHKLIRARITHVIHDNRWGSLRKTGGGLPEQQHHLYH